MHVPFQHRHGNKQNSSNNTGEKLPIQQIKLFFNKQRRQPSATQASRVRIQSPTPIRKIKGSNNSECNCESEFKKQTVTRSFYALIPCRKTI